MSDLDLSSRELGHWRVSHIEAGAGLPVVLLHGSADTAFVWKPVLADLALDHRVCALDLGRTRSIGAGPEPARLRADLGLLLDLVASLGGPVHLVGHSYGALLALRFALAHPRELRSLCLAEPIAFGLLREHVAGGAAEGLVVPVLAGFLAAWERGERGAAIEIILDYWNGAGSWAALPAVHQERIVAGATRFHAEVFCAYEDRTRAAEVSTVAVPTLVVSGARTTDAALRVCDLLARSIPGARSLRVPGAGHSPMRTHPGPFLRALRPLLEAADRQG